MAAEAAAVVNGHPLPCNKTTPGRQFNCLPGVPHITKAENFQKSPRFHGIGDKLFHQSWGFIVGINNPCDSSDFIMFHLTPFATKVNGFFNFFASSCFIMCYANGVVTGVVDRMLLIYLFGLCYISLWRVDFFTATMLYCKKLWEILRFLYK